MRGRTQIDFGDIALQYAAVDDQMFQRVQLFLPAGFRQLHHHPVIQDEIPTALRLARVSRDASAGSHIRDSSRSCQVS